MKNSIIITFAIALFTVFGSNAQSKNKDHFTVQVDGLGCPFCAFGLEKKFQKLDGISNIKIDIEKGILDFDFKAENKLALSEVKYQVESSGYTPVLGEVVRANGKEEAVTFSSEEVAEEEGKTQLQVNGNCDMCKARIEKAALAVDGVNAAVWDMKTKLLTLDFDTEKVDKETIEKAVAQAGHDTESFKAADSTYNSLHGCCQYKRKK